MENIKYPLVTKISNEKVRGKTGQSIVTDVIRAPLEAEEDLRSKEGE